MAKIIEGGITLFYGAKHECEQIAAAMRAESINVNVEELA